jgi:tetratricopeptide (TPR) repeat protein
MTREITTISKAARSCHTKQAWSHFISTYGDSIAQTTSKKLVTDVFKILKSDVDSLKYGTDIFLTLLKGARHSSHLELALEIGIFCTKIRTIEFYLEMILVHFENSDPKSARVEANKALRLSKLSAKDELILRMHVVSSYAEEGKYSKATSMFDDIEKLTSSEELTKEDKYDFIVKIGRLHFFLGNYNAAIPFYKKASDYYMECKNWEIAAKCLFNAGACLSNSDNSNQEESFYYIETCRQICEKNNLSGPLAHIESFYGLNAYQTGNFTEAKEYFYAALQHTQDEEAKFNRLHFLSMLSLTCYASGKFHLAKKYAEQTLRLAEDDESDRYRTRYINLEAEMLWQEGKTEKSHELLKPAIEKLLTKGLYTLEELATFNMYTSQEAALNGKDFSMSKVKVADSLKKNSFNWLELKYCISELLLNSNQTSEAHKNYLEILESAEKKDNKHHYALALYGLIKIKLLKNQLDEEFHALARRFGIAVARIANTPLKAETYIIQAAIKYRNGELSECLRHLKAAQKTSSLTSINKILLSAWINTLEGKSTKVSSKHQLSIITRFTNIFFNPSIKATGAHTYEISGKYTIDLSKQPKVNDLVKFILNRNAVSFTSENLQRDVWGQSTRLTGWQQKVRNTIQRLRQIFSPCIVPIIIVQDDIRFYSECISVVTPEIKTASKETILKELLKTKSCSSAEIADHIGTSTATAKRTIKSLVESNQIKAIKNGRSITYIHTE